MPRNQGTSRKGKPKKYDRAAGLGRSLQKKPAPKHRYQAGGGMARSIEVSDIGVVEDKHEHNTKSILEMHDLDDYLEQADLANREYTVEKASTVVVESTARFYTGRSVQFVDHSSNSIPDKFEFSELSVPRRPLWDASMSKQQLEAQENAAFLEWRRGIAKQEEYYLSINANKHVTPFEKNLEVWRQLWRVLERCSCLLQLVDARNPLFYLSKDLQDYANSLNKPMMVLFNKSDYLSDQQRRYWRDYLIASGWNVPIFFSAKAEQVKLDDFVQNQRKQQQQSRDESVAYRVDDNDHDDDTASELENSDSSSTQNNTDMSPRKADDDTRLLSREELIEAMLDFAHSQNCQADPKYQNRIQFGMVGFPNVGKSSVINVLVGSSKHAHGVVRVGVASQPGKTKHFQTLLLDDYDSIMLCDCPGLCFPSFVSNTADLIAAGVYPIAQMRDFWPVITLICQRIPREILNAQYGIHLPIVSEQEMRERGLTSMPPPTAQEFLDTFCIARSMLAASSGVPDHQRGSRLIIKDYADGKLLYCHPPPGIDGDAFARETTNTALRNTEKLRKRLEKQQQQAVKAEVVVEENGIIPSGAENSEDEFDQDLFDLMGGDSSLLTNDRSKHNKYGRLSKKGKTPKQKWGKKDRKNRNKDPYGCHSTPDESVFGVSSSGGVLMNAGKYSRGGYTRPKTYPVPGG